MKNILAIFIGMMLILSAVGCSSEDPQFRIRNEQLEKANVQLKTSGGNTVNINDVLTGQTTAYQSAAEGSMVATAVIQNESVSPTITFFCGVDKKYTIVVTGGKPPTLRVE